MNRFGLYLSLLAALLISSPMAAALGLGELEHKAHLHQKFSGQIAITDSDGVALDEIRITLAGADIFEKAGIDRAYELQKLKFSVVETPDGPAVQIVSEVPVTEPAIKFIVEALWPEGRLLKTYTVLLAPASL